VAAWSAVTLLGSVNDGQGVAFGEKRVRRQQWSFCGCEGGSREREMWLRLSESCGEEEGVTVVFWLVGGAVVKVFWLGGRFVCVRRCKGGRMNHDEVVVGALYHPLGHFELWGCNGDVSCEQGWCGRFDGEFLWW